MNQNMTVSTRKLGKKTTECLAQQATAAAYHAGNIHVQKTEYKTFGEAIITMTGWQLEQQQQPQPALLSRKQQNKTGGAKLKRGTAGSIPCWARLRGKQNQKHVRRK